MKINKILSHRADIDFQDLEVCTGDFTAATSPSSNSNKKFNGTLSGLNTRTLGKKSLEA